MIWQYFPEISKFVSNFHRELSRSGIQYDFANAAIETTTLLEMMVMKFDMCTSRATPWLKSWFEEFQKLFENYQERAWSYPAADIALKTIKGRSKEKVIRKLKEKITQSNDFVERDLADIRRRLREKDLIPTPNEIRLFCSQ
jgi:lipopolysaccharide biosynthesis glycosyltransferase